MSAVLAEVTQEPAAKWGSPLLADVADILDSQRVPINAKERETRPGTIPYYGATGQVGWIDQHKFDEELVLLGEDGAPFFEPRKPKAYVIRGKTWVNNHAHVLRAKSVPTGWLAHYLNSISYVGLVTGTTRLKLTQAAMRQIRVPVAPWHVMERIVAEIEKQFSRLDEAVANLKRVKANLKRFEKATIEHLTDASAFQPVTSGSIADMAISLDNLRRPVNKIERAKRPGSIPYLGANGQTGWIDEALFDEDLVLVVEDETFVGRTAPFSYFFSGKCWVNNHTHVLRARPEIVLPKYLNAALSYYPFIPLTTGSTGRRKLTKAALMSAPITMPCLSKQREIVAEVDRRLSFVREVEAEVDTNLKRAQALRQATLARAFVA